MRIDQIVRLALFLLLVLKMVYNRRYRGALVEMALLMAWLLSLGRLGPILCRLRIGLVAGCTRCDSRSRRVR